MTIDPPRPGPVGEDQAGSALSRVLGRLTPGRAARASEDPDGRRPYHPRLGPGRDRGLAAAAAVQRRRREPGAVPAVRRRARSAAAGHPVRHAGHRRLAGPVVPYHLATLPSLLAGLLDQLGYAQADVLGISWGGGLAQQFALSRPDRVRRLVLVATGPGSLMVPGRPWVLLRMLTPRRHRDPGYAARVAGELYGGSAREDPALARDLLHATTRPGLARGYYYQLIASLGWTSLPWLPKLRPPTLILAGDDDPIIPLVNARIMHRLIPRSQLHIYHGGHLELAVDSEGIASVVEAFLGPEGADDDTGG